MSKFLDVVDKIIAGKELTEEEELILYAEEEKVKHVVKGKKWNED